MTFEGGLLKDELITFFGGKRSSSPVVNAESERCKNLNLHRKVIKISFMANVTLTGVILVCIEFEIDQNYTFNHLFSMCNHCLFIFCILLQVSSASQRSNSDQVLCRTVNDSLIRNCFSFSAAGQHL